MKKILRANQVQEREEQKGGQGYVKLDIPLRNGRFNKSGGSKTHARREREQVLTDPTTVGCLKFVGCLMEKGW